MPLSPAHLKKQQQADGSIQFSWVRRSRVDADGWLGTDIPLGEAAERYRISILNASGAVIRQSERSEPQWLWTASLQAADAVLSPAKFEVAQLSEAIGAGIPASVAL